MKRYVRYAALPVALAALAAVLALRAAAAGGRVPEDSTPAGRPPVIRPDYAGIVIPPNIAPLNFLIEEPGSDYFVEIRAAAGEPVRVRSGSPDVVIPMKPWRRLLAANPGGQLLIDVYVKGSGGRWQRFEPVTNTIAREKADPYIVYREMNVIFCVYAKMRICQRSIESYDETVVLDNESFGGCMNCHTFRQNRADQMLMHVRSSTERNYGSGMLLFQDGEVTKVDARTQYGPGMAAFASWHPSGRAVAYSVNMVRQFFHPAGADVREGMDLKSDLALYMVDSGKVTTTKAISRPDRLETWPAWSADGKHLYYCSGPVWWHDDEDGLTRYREARYDLMRIAYDIDAGTWGEAETVLTADEAGVSISQPRPSPDGRFLVVTGAPHGGFPVLEPEADLYLLDLDDGGFRPLESNSDQTESWHSWSSEGRWMVVSSKQGDGLFTRPFLTYIDERGMASKPFVLPQKDPAHYDRHVKIYHLCEFVRDPVPVRGERLARIIRDAEWQQVDVLVTQASPAAAPTGEQPKPFSESAGEIWRSSGRE